MIWLLQSNFSAVVLEATAGHEILSLSMLMHHLYRQCPLSISIKLRPCPQRDSSAASQVASLRVLLAVRGVATVRTSKWRIAKTTSTCVLELAVMKTMTASSAVWKNNCTRISIVSLFIFFFLWNGWHRLRSWIYRRTWEGMAPCLFCITIYSICTRWSCSAAILQHRRVESPSVLVLLGLF